MGEPPRRINMFHPTAMYCWIMILSLLLIPLNAFTIIQPQQQQQQQRVLSSSSQLACICIDCKWVTTCQAYHFVETKHEQPHMTETPEFEPRDGSPTIHVNVRTIRTKEQHAQEIQRMWKEHVSETKNAEAKAAAAATADDPLHGETVYDFSPVTTYEYDVVACEDFVEDQGCWIRNMPDEIREANPDFVPS